MIQYLKHLLQKIKEFYREPSRIVWTLLICGLLIMIAIYVSYSIEKKARVLAEEIAAAAVVPPPVISAEDSIVAVLRQDRNADKVCYDAGLHAWLIHFPYDIFEYMQLPLNEDGTEKSKSKVTQNVWFYVDKLKFWQLQNKTWMMQDIPNKDYARVWPDVTGMTCKTSSEIIR